MNLNAEWLEADGLGGFASGTVSGIRTRRYHALLLAATTPPTGRLVLVNGLEVTVETPAGNFALSSQLYAPDVEYPDGMRRIAGFDPEPWPRWTYHLEDGTGIEQQILAQHGAPTVAVSWRLLEPRPGVTLSVRPLLSGRDFHFLHRENPAFRFEAEQQDRRIVWQPYPGLPAVVAASNGQYLHRPDWYRNFLYEAESKRGLDAVEDLASPGVFRFDLSSGEAALTFSTRADAPPLEEIRAAERTRRGKLPDRLHRSADAYLVRRGSGKTIVAGYPWFSDWGRDTFISLRGLCLATGRTAEARDILLEWTGAVSEGMLPNRFPDHGETPEFNSVDASLWFVIAVHELLKTKICSKEEQQKLRAAIEAILSGYTSGTRYGIHMDADGLLAAGVPGAQITWMDAKVGDWVVTPRIGKPVEVQALWLNALKIGGREELFQRGRLAFQTKFWNQSGRYLYDVVDPTDAAFRPNQIFAVGGLPFAMLEGERACRVVETVEARLWTPLGLRSLAPGEPGYAPHYAGGALERDGAYHQGTVWPWLAGPFVEAWVRVRGGTEEAKSQARARFLEPLLARMDDAGLGHISEIADAEPPHTPGGCPFQAWSLGEALRLHLKVLAGD